MKKNIVFCMILLLTATTVHAFAKAPVIVEEKGNTIQADAQGNTLEALRQELKQTIDSEKSTFNEKKSAIQKIIRMESAPDVVYLIEQAVKVQESKLAKVIKKEFMGYSNTAFIKEGLVLAGKEKSNEVNLLAANMLVDMKAYVEGLKVSASLIKKGVISKEVIHLFDRVPEPGKLEGREIGKDMMLYNQDVQKMLSGIISNNNMPMKIRTFVLLIGPAYYEGELSSKHKSQILTVLEIADEEYVENAVGLLERCLDGNKKAKGMARLIIKELTESEYAAIAARAKKNSQKEWLKKRKTWRNIVQGTSDEEKHWRREDAIPRYLYTVGNTPEEVRFLMNMLKNKKESERIKIQLVEAVTGSEHHEEIVDELKKIVARDGSEKLVLVLDERIKIHKKLEETAILRYENYLAWAVGNQDVSKIDLHDEEQLRKQVVKVIRKYKKNEKQQEIYQQYKTYINDPKVHPVLRGYFAIMIPRKLIDNPQRYRSTIEEALKKADFTKKYELLSNIGICADNNLEYFKELLQQFIDANSSVVSVQDKSNVETAKKILRKLKRK